MSYGRTEELRWRRPGIPRMWGPFDAAPQPGLRVRAVPGRKAEGDLRVELLAPTFVAVTFETLWLLGAVLYDNEEHLYPCPLDGGERFVRGLRTSIQVSPAEASRREFGKCRSALPEPLGLTLRTARSSLSTEG
jgi:hypothetical protein